MNNSMILVVEDDAAIRHLIVTALEMKQYHQQSVENGKQAIAEILSYHPDVLLLDLGLPDMDGIELIRKIRTWSKMPIIVISARSEDADKIEALDAGADDYLTKPFSIDELHARLRVVFRRLNEMNQLQDNAIYINKDLKIDFSAQLVYMNQREVHLTSNEYKLLVILAKNTGKVLTHNYLTHAIWGSSFESDVATLRVFMAALRKKIEKDTSNPQYIQTHIGIGYRLVKNEG